MLSRPGTLIRISALLVCLCFSSMSLAIERIELSIEQILFDSLSATHPEAYQDLHLDQLNVTLDISTSPAALNLELGKLKLPEPYQNISALKLVCQSFSIRAPEFSCQKGHLTVTGLEAKDIVSSTDFAIKYNTATDKLSLNLEHLSIAKGELSAQFQFNNDQWQANIQARNLEYASLKSYLQYYFKDFLTGIDELGLHSSFSAKLSGVKETVESIEFTGDFDKIHYLHGDDIAENLSFQAQFKHHINKDNMQINFDIKKPRGEIYQNEVYLVLTGNERFRGNLTYLPVTNILDVSSFKINIANILSFHSKGLIDLSADEVNFKKLTASLDMKNWKQFSHLYLNNILEGTDYEGLKIEGAFKGRFKQDRQLIAVSAEPVNLSLAFNESEDHEQFSFDKLNGKVFWNNHLQKKSPVADSYLSWEHAGLNEVPLGQTKLKFTTHNGNLKLLNETEIPLFDGALQINNLNIKNIAQSMTLSIDGMIKPVSLEQVSEHFGWPLLDGKLSAVIPETTYNEHYLEVGGAMMLQVFDGNIIIKDLSIEQPLLDSARLFANIDLNNLNLQSLTKTYNFGEILGRVEGKFTDLVLQSWQPVAFDAYIRTPENDNSRHRISQRAIDNLSSLGGASGLLSRSFLKFFETFGYDKIGLSCKLKNNVCEMSGVEVKGNSYYIVKGGGVPRIDVMGFQNRVNWQVLTSRLQAIQSANEAVIE